MRIPATDSRITWLGVVDREVRPTWVRPWRLPVADHGLYAPDILSPAGRCSGMRIAFRAATRRLALAIVDPDANARPFVLVRDGEEVAAVRADAAGQVVFPDQDGADHAFEVWLPQNAAVRLAQVEVDEGAGFAKGERSHRAWLHYGSSISQCGEADLPTHTWPGRVARTHGVDLTSWGFGGQCHLDPLVARVMGARRADAISIKVGINIYGQASLGPRTFRSNAIAFVRLLREAHPSVPLAVISPIFSPVREALVNRAGLTLQMMRADLATAVEALRAHGDDRVHYLDGLHLFGPTDRDCLPDFLHPDTEGYRRIAERFSARLGPVLFGS